jgi:hypothetical protein
MKSDRLNVLPRKFISVKAGAGDPDDAAEYSWVSCFRENDMENWRAPRPVNFTETHSNGEIAT